MKQAYDRTFVLDAIRENRRRLVFSALLFFLIVLIVAFIIAISVPEDVRWTTDMLITAAISLGITLLVFPLLYFLGLRSSKVVMERLFPPVTLEEKDRLKLESAVEGIALAAGLEDIKIRIVSMEGVNSISVGANTEDAEILISREAVEGLDRGELEVMLAHEVYHVISGDIRLWALGTGLSSAIMLPLAAECGNWIMPGLHEDQTVLQFNYHPVYGTMLDIVGRVLSVILFPLWFAFYLTVIPKSRDHLADEHALLLTRSPEDVIRAIELSDMSRSRCSLWGGLFISHMLFNQPLDPPRGAARIFAYILNTHTPATERAERIRSMG